MYIHMYVLYVHIPNMHAHSIYSPLALPPVTVTVNGRVAVKLGLCSIQIVDAMPSSPITISSRKPTKIAA